MMELKDIHIMMDKATGKHNIFYGDLKEDYDEDELAGMEEMSDKYWCVDDYVHILEMLLEDNNLHSLMYLPQMIADSLRRSGLTIKSQMCEITKSYFKHFDEK